MFSRFLIKFLFCQEKEFNIFLGTVKQKGSTVVFINTQRIWQQESLIKKIKSIVNFRWTPTDELIQTAARETLNSSIFGNAADYNQGLFKINAWHNSQRWYFDKLSEVDTKKSESLDALTILIRTKHRRITSDSLHLSIASKAPQMCMLLHPMVVKIPVTSILYYLDIHSAFAFNEIRQSDIESAEDLIAYIYELQFIQQKIALSLHEFLYLIDYNEREKGNSMLIAGELSAITEAEAIFAYLKSSIEKMIIVLGLIYGIKNLQDKKTHKAKLTSLESGIPEEVKKLFYWEFIFEFIKSESIETLNNYRTGFLHKKGISELQPHRYVGIPGQEIPFKKLLNFFIEQHSKNTAVLIGVYALLTDELVKINPVSIKPQDLPY